jgi:hypothetical protein
MIGKLSERQVSSGSLSQDACYRLIVTGRYGPREIARLIRKLELEREALWALPPATTPPPSPPSAT